MSNSIIPTWQALKIRSDEQLATLFDKLEVPSKRLKAAMQYAVLSSGKRLRPILIYLSAKTLNISVEKVDNVSNAVECMHAYSLIHDDLPAMDNDDLRRGKPTCHRAFDEATAILAGDALQALAFQQIFLVNANILTAEQKNEMAMLLSVSCGAQGMVSGQAMDLEYLDQEVLSVDLLQKVHQLKTGILLESCIDLAIAASAGTSDIAKKSLRSFAKHLGLAFQIQDDYLDAYGETEILGKERGADERQGKTTYATLYSKQDLFELIEKIYIQAIVALNPLKESAKELIEFTEYLAQRNN